MLSLFAPVVFTLFLWWFSTGIILLADRLPRVSPVITLAIATGLAAIALAATLVVREQTTVTGSYIGFLAGLTLWAWHEVSFLTGALTGPRKTACPDNVRMGQRFAFATQTLLHHEVAIALTVAVLAVLHWSAANPIAAWTFTILWVMRLSTKFNIFLGVSNLTEEFLPHHLGHLKSYFGTRAVNGLFPISVTAGTIATVLLAVGATTATTPFDATAMTLLATLCALGTLEHWFLVLPWRDAELWRWYLKKRQDRTNLPTAGTNNQSHPSIYHHKSRTTAHSAAPEGALLHRGLLK